jgi:hypothetical protein
MLKFIELLVPFIPLMNAQNDYCTSDSECGNVVPV